MRYFSILVFCCLLSGCGTNYYLNKADKAAKAILDPELKAFADRKKLYSESSWDDIQSKDEDKTSRSSGQKNDTSSTDLSQPDSSDTKSEPENKSSVAVDKEDGNSSAEITDPISDFENTNIASKLKLVPDGAKMLSLQDALQLATDHNRNYQNRREELIVSALSLNGVRHNFGYLLSGSLDVDGDWEDAFNRRMSRTESLSLAINKILYTGANLSISGSGSMDHDFESSTDTADSSVTISVTQPLLRGAGHAISHENLTQAERVIIYDIRDFDRFREQFTIQILNDYYNLVGQKQRLQNQIESLTGLRFLRERSEALFKVGRGSGVDVLRARQNELQAENDQNTSIEAYRASLDDFKITLGLNVDENIDIINTPPDFIPVTLDLQKAIETALAYRLDFQTRHDRHEDTRRRYKIARNDLLPDLDASASYTLNAEDSGTFSNQNFNSRNFSFGLSLDLPLDRLDERNALKTARLNLDRSRREVDLMHDQIVVEIRDALRTLRQNKVTLEIQEQIIESNQKQLKITRLRFQNGQATNRDVVDAERDLLRAKNTYINTLISYEISRIRLLRSMGILVVHENGQWKELGQ